MEKLHDKQHFENSQVLYCVKYNTCGWQKQKQYVKNIDMIAAIKRKYKKHNVVVTNCNGNIAYQPNRKVGQISTIYLVALRNAISAT
jgi:hypothetical protein